ncbi:hypothetical protein CEXT_653211 [Caerostris extrusa]|uniref:Ycf15 n=1 Tax=Caerostris extrusa TaxID=172846 RepID=A0AAV4WD51_CAEEX|nr:hypothetical protein CEXT_653211 [Caerostris extrusa]
MGLQCRRVRSKGMSDFGFGCRKASQYIRISIHGGPSLPLRSKSFPISHSTHAEGFCPLNSPFPLSRHSKRDAICFRACSGWA